MNFLFTEKFGNPVINHSSAARTIQWPAFAIAFVSLIALACDFADAQKIDNVYRYSGTSGASKVAGKVVDMTPEGVIVESRGRKETVAAQDIRKIVYGGQQSALDRTRERIMSGNYGQGLEELTKIDAKGNAFVAHEIAFLTAWSEGKMALRGEKPLKEGGSAVNSFLKKYEKSYHFYPMTELKGRLLLGLKLVDLATGEYQKLADSPWPEYALKGKYLLANAFNSQGKHAEAIAQCDSIISSSDNSDIAQRYQRLAQSEKAKSQALAGETDGVEEVLKQIIKVENPDDKRLFAATYNAWGVYHYQANRWKEAREKFLMTHLLMSSESDSHAEALYYLSQIWPKFENTDEANKSRELLQSRYRNSFWAQKLN